MMRSASIPLRPGVFDATGFMAIVDYWAVKWNLFVVNEGCCLGTRRNGASDGSTRIWTTGEWFAAFLCNVPNDNCNSTVEPQDKCTFKEVWMCKRCASLEYQLSLCALTFHVAKVWQKEAPHSQIFQATQKLRAAEQLLDNAEGALLRHRRGSGCDRIAA
jgi:hypothetical protein